MSSRDELLRQQLAGTAPPPSLRQEYERPVAYDAMSNQELLDEGLRQHKDTTQSAKRGLQVHEH